MKTKILIEQLQRQVELHGDIEVGFFDTENSRYLRVEKMNWQKRKNTGKHPRYEDDPNLGREYLGLI